LTSPMDWIALSSAVVSVVVFANTWQGQFVYDDRWVEPNHYFCVYLMPKRAVVNQVAAHFVSFRVCHQMESEIFMASGSQRNELAGDSVDRLHRLALALISDVDGFKIKGNILPKER
jgi:hypothetical protein